MGQISDISLISDGRWNYLRRENRKKDKQAVGVCGVTLQEDDKERER